MDPVVAPASTPAIETPEPLSPTDTLSRLSDSALHSWRETGEIPASDRPDPDDEADDEPAPLPAAASAPASAPVSKRQQKINDQIRVAVENALAAPNAELARLRAAQSPARPVAPQAPAPRPAAAQDLEPNPTDATKYPGGEYDPKYLRDVARWDHRQALKTRDEQFAASARDEQAHRQFEASVHIVSGAFKARIDADPAFKDRLNGHLLSQLIPFSQLPPNMPGGPLNAIAEEMMARPETAPDVAEYLSSNPAELARLTATDRRTGVPVLSARMLIRELGRIEARIERAATAPPSLPNTITDAPAPPTVLSRSTSMVDPVDAAVQRQDVSAYIAAANAKELAAMRK